MTASQRWHQTLFSAFRSRDSYPRVTKKKSLIFLTFTCSFLTQWFQISLLIWVRNCFLLLLLPCYLKHYWFPFANYRSLFKNNVTRVPLRNNLFLLFNKNWSICSWCFLKNVIYIAYFWRTAKLVSCFRNRKKNNFQLNNNFIVSIW